MSFPLVQFESSDPRRTLGASGARPSRRDFLTGAPRRHDDYWIRVHRRAMACRFEITLESRDAAAVPAARDALNEIDRLEEALSVFRDTSIVSEINRRAAHAAVAVDDATFELLDLCGQLHAQTGGAFDITSTPLSRCWGFLQRVGRLPDRSAINEARARVGFDAVRLDAASRSVRFTRSGLELNLGAIGKGYALDRVAETMRDAGAAQALLSAGQSSMLAIGGRGAGWFVELVSLRSDGSPVADVHLHDAAIGTSGAGDQFVIADGVRYGHVIDPRTGWPASGVESASVIASSAAVADALSTAFLVGGVALASAYCAEHANVMAILTEEGAHMPRVFGQHPGARVRPRRVKRVRAGEHGAATEVTR
ncbi:MAG TPA: FAD:protein FMN transferase [Vicinamibacterales bacterium]|nr:FAD:protein FMN transferase [Vicinamibacterales bacterium]